MKESENSLGLMKVTFKGGMVGMGRWGGGQSLEFLKIKFLRRAGPELYCPINGDLRGTLVSRKNLGERKLFRKAEMES